MFLEAGFFNLSAMFNFHNCYSVFMNLKERMDFIKHIYGLCVVVLIPASMFGETGRGCLEHFVLLGKPCAVEYHRLQRTR